MYSWISQDICFCLSNSCPIKEYCFRPIGCRSRIATYSQLDTGCNHQNIFVYFVQAPMDLVNEKRRQREGLERC